VTRADSSTKNTDTVLAASIVTTQIDVVLLEALHRPALTWSSVPAGSTARARSRQAR